MLVLEHILVRVLARVQHGVRHRQPSPHSSGSSLHLQHSFLLSVKPSSPAIGVWNLYVAFGCPSLRDGIAFSRFMAGSDEETGESCLARRWSKQTLTQRVPSSPPAHFGSRRFLNPIVDVFFLQDFTIELPGFVCIFYRYRIPNELNGGGAWFKCGLGHQLEM